MGSIREAYAKMLGEDIPTKAYILEFYDAVANALPPGGVNKARLTRGIETLLPQLEADKEADQRVAEIIKEFLAEQAVQEWAQSNRQGLIDLLNKYKKRLKPIIDKNPSRITA